jgi:hypothetical protein
MPKIPEIEFKDVTIAEKYTDHYDYEQCRKGLWSIYNIIKRIRENRENKEDKEKKENTDSKVLECLYMIGVNAKFDDKESILIYTGKTNKKYKRNMPAIKYLFELENYGFIINIHNKEY